ANRTAARISSESMIWFVGMGLILLINGDATTIQESSQRFVYLADDFMERGCLSSDRAGKCAGLVHQTLPDGHYCSLGAIFYA
ncbi:MAG: hypothetical protein JWN30_1129, partial [Bacilli bacterium]|nr:hypothetical protein [Bacilli bacterium]